MQRSVQCSKVRQRSWAWDSTKSVYSTTSSLLQNTVCSLDSSVFDLSHRLRRSSNDILRSSSSSSVPRLSCLPVACFVFSVCLSSFRAQFNLNYSTGLKFFFFLIFHNSFCLNASLRLKRINSY